MEVLRYIQKIIKQITSLILLLCCAISLTTVSAQDYRLDVLAKLPTISPENIVTVIPLPISKNNSQPFFFADENGEISLLSDTKLVSLAKLPLSSQASTKHVKLTALTLHPSFSLADQQGYQTFYTAHIEPRKTNNNTARLTILEQPIALPFDAVITQWQFDSTAINKIDEQHRREVMRIAVPTATHQIQHIAFNPYSKIWHDDYALMHVALSEHQDKLTNKAIDALYSGVVLRINPAKFGLRNYKVPSSNPFVKTPNINNEIFILGAQSIDTFTWSKQYFDALLVQHTYGGSHQVVVANKGADWRASNQKKLVFPLKSAQHASNQIFTYYGRNLKTLIGSVLYIAHNTKNWQLTKLNASLTRGNIAETATEQTLWSFDRDKLSPKNRVSPLLNQNGELLLLDFTNKQLLSVNPIQAETNSGLLLNKQAEADKSIEQPVATNSNAYGKLILFLFLVVMAFLFYRLRPKSNKTKAKLRRQFARFELDDSKATLSLYKRHLSTVDSTVAISDIVKSEVYLNGRNINLINKDKDHGYSDQLEKQLRLSFAQAHRHKLINDEVREAQLYLTDQHAQMYVICLYLRKGNQRLTKEKYFDALESLIDWSWFIAKQLNPNATGEREIKVIAAEKPVYSPQPKRETLPTVREQQAKKETQVAKSTNEELHNIAMHDSELINSLDKLADLKQKGFLTPEEFSLAKSRILSDITDNK